MTRVVVTGAAGFIGSNIVKGLNARGIDDIIAVDDLTQGDKFRNLADLQIADYVDLDMFYDLFAEGFFGKVEAVFHEGACSDTMETDGKYMMDNNYTLSCGAVQRLPGARHAAALCVVGGGVRRLGHLPRNARVRASAQRLRLLQAAVRPAHAARMRQATSSAPSARWRAFATSTSTARASSTRAAWPASPSTSSTSSAREGKVKLFGEYGGYGAGRAEARLRLHRRRGGGELWFFDHPDKSGIFNLGTGRAQPFNDVAVAVVNALRTDPSSPASTRPRRSAKGLIEYIPFPDALRGKYQCYTQADLAALRDAGCDHAFADVADRRRRSYMARAAPPPERLQPRPGDAGARVSRPSAIRVRPTAPPARRHAIQPLPRSNPMLKKILAVLVMLLHRRSPWPPWTSTRPPRPQLDSVKGIGPVTSKLIMAERKKGEFKSWQDFIDRVKGIGESRAAKLSAEGLTVNGAAYKAAAATKKDEKAAAKDDKKEAKAAAKEEKKEAKAAAKDEKKEAKAAAKDEKKDAKAAAKAAKRR